MRSVITSLALFLVITACKHPSQVRERPPTAAEIRQKIVGTWFLHKWAPDGAARVITVTFGADGSFESSRNFTDFFGAAPRSSSDQTYHAMWRAADGYFTVTKSNALPNSNLQMFMVDRLDEHEMICGHPSVGDRDRFRR